MLIPPASITGTVTDRSGNTLGGLEVVLFKASEYPAQVTRNGPPPTLTGRYSFADVDAPQAYVLEVRSTTLGAIGSATLVLAASQAAVLNITVGSARRRRHRATPSSCTVAPAAPGRGFRRRRIDHGLGPGQRSMSPGPG